MKQLRIRSGIVAAVAAAFGTGLTSISALGQQPASGEVQRVEITGSNIKRIEGETALPVQIITREEIEKTGAPNVEQFLQGLGVALQGNSNSVSATSSGATAGGVSSVSLRGLGSQRTLVLIDGKRVSAGGTITDSVTVDVNMIPTAALERIEVLKDGASAIYGSDAIAGVVNFILRKDYRGGEVTAYGGVTEQGGGQVTRINGMLGWGDLAKDGFNATIFALASKEKPIFGRDRGFAAVGIRPEFLNDTSSGNTFPANFVAADGSFGTRNLFFANPPVAGTCPPPYSHFSSLFADLLGSQGCRFDPSGLVTLLPDIETTSVFGSFRLKLARDHEAYAQLSYTHKEQDTVIQPNPISDQFALPANHPLFGVAPFNGFNTFLLTPASPFYPTAFVQAQTGGATPDLLIRYRASVNGDRKSTNISDQPRIVLGVKGTLGRFDYDVSYLHTETRLTEQLNSGFPLATRILPLLNTGTVNPFGPNTPATIAAVKATEFVGDAYKTKNTIDNLGAKAAVDLTKLQGGPLALAFGAEARKETFKITASPEIQIGDIEGYGGNFFPVDVSRNVAAAFAEVSAPFLRNLEVTAAVRYDHYQNVGSTTRPKAGVRWQPMRELLVRGSVGQGFRAPSLTELHQPQQSGVSAPGLNDPLRCPVTGGVNDCVTQFPVTLGGNAALKPERSINSSIGFVLEPTANFSVGIDYWQVHLRDPIIFGVTPATILGDPARFGGLITRGACSAGDIALFAAAGLPCVGPITNIDQRNLNLGWQRVWGADLDVRYRFQPRDWGTFTVGLNGTYIAKYDIAQPDGTFISINGQVSPIVQGAGGVIPRWRHYAYLDWKRGPWNFTLAEQYQSKYTDLFGTFDGPPSAPRKVESYELWHLYGSYTGWKDVKLTFGIRNLLDKDPPYTNAGGQNYFQAGYDPGYADPRGRFYYASFTWKFM